MKNPELLEIIRTIQNLDKTSIIRGHAGDAAFRNFEPIYNEIISKLKVIEKNHEHVDPYTNSMVLSNLIQIKGILQALSKADSNGFANLKEHAKNQVGGLLNSIREFWPHYPAAAIERLGLLEIDDFIVKLASLGQELNEIKEKALDEVTETANKIVSDAVEKSDKIIATARKTVTKISVKEAQEQFTEAALNNKFHVRIWGAIASSMVLAFIGFIIYLLFVDFSEGSTTKIIYLSVIRLGILGLISSILHFSLKMLRANLHMQQHNLHRKRVANSMAVFVESAMSDEQRDIILSQLVQSVSIFGDSGLILSSKDGSNISIDPIIKMVGGLKGAE